MSLNRLECRIKKPRTRTSKIRIIITNKCQNDWQWVMRTHRLGLHTGSNSNS